MLHCTRTYGTADSNSKKLNINVGDTTKTTHTLTSTYTEYEYIPTEGDLTGSGAISFVCPGGTNDSSNGKGLRIQRITIRYVDDSMTPKILDGEIAQVPARSSNGRFIIQTKNIDSALEVLNYDGIDFVDIPAIENNNELVYTVSDNDSKDVKNGTITVALASDNSVTGTISISQAAARFSAARTSVDLKAAANSQTTVTITSDFDWTIEGVDSKYSVSPTSFTYDPDASEPGKKTITIKATDINSGNSTVELGSFSIVNVKSGLESIDIYVNQISSKLSAPNITGVDGRASDKQAVIRWTKVDNADTYTYYLIDDNAEEVAGSRKITADNNVLTATVDIPEYGSNYYFCIFANGSGEWTNSSEATSAAINLTEPSGGPTEIYYETFGDNGANNTALASYTGFSDDRYSVSGDTTAWKASKNNVGTSNYEGASGKSNMWCNTTNKAATIAFGDLSSYSKVTLYFGILNDASTKNNRTCSVTISGDGGTTYGGDILATSNSQAWRYITYEVPAASLSNLVVKFTNTASNYTRVDDIKVVVE